MDFTRIMSLILADNSHDPHRSGFCLRKVSVSVKNSNI